MLTKNSVTIGHLLVATWLLVGCATTYHPENNTGGYTDTQLSDGRYIVTFRGNADTARADVEQMAKRRAGEVCGGGYQILDMSELDQNVVVGSGTGFASFNKPGVKYTIKCD